MVRIPSSTATRPTIRGSGGPGKVYEIPGSELSTGLPYRGRTRQKTIERRLSAKDHRAKTPTGKPPRAGPLAEDLTVEEMEGLEALLIEEVGLEHLTNKIRGLDPSLPKNKAKIEAARRLLEQQRKAPR